MGWGMVVATHLPLPSMTAPAPPPPGDPIDVDLGSANATAQAFDGDPSAPALLVVPALGVPAKHYQALGHALARRGLNAMVMDLRGVGASSVRARRGVDWGYLDLVDGELNALFHLSGKRWPQAPRQWLGHSLGGHLSLLHQARHPDQRVERVRLVASGSPWHRNYPRPHNFAVHAFGRFARGSSRLLGVFRGDWVRFGGTQGATLMQEWGNFCLRGRLGRLGTDRWDADAALARVEVPVAGLCMAGDTYAPQRSTEQLAALTRGPLALQRLDTLPHGAKPGHFLWMRHPEPVAELLAGS